MMAAFSILCPGRDWNLDLAGMPQHFDGGMRLFEEGQIEDFVSLSLARLCVKPCEKLSHMRHNSASCPLSSKESRPLLRGVNCCGGLQTTILGGPDLWMGP